MSKMENPSKRIPDLEWSLSTEDLELAMHKKTFYLADGKIKDSSTLENLNSLLTQSTTLTELVIMNVEITSDSEDPLKFITDGLAQNESITHVCFYLIKVTGKENHFVAQAIAEALKINKSIQYVSFIGTEFGDQGFKYISDSFMHNNTINQIILGGSDIGDRAAEYIAKGLQNNLSLRDLYIHATDIGDVGTKALAKMLDSTYVASVGMSANKSGDVGTKALANLIKVNPFIQTLSLGYNKNISADGFKAIENALKYNGLINKITVSNDIKNNSIGFAIKEMLRENETSPKLTMDNFVQIFKLAHLAGISDNHPHGEPHLFYLPGDILMHILEFAIDPEFDFLLKAKLINNFVKIDEECFNKLSNVNNNNSEEEVSIGGEAQIDYNIID